MAAIWTAVGSGLRGAWYGLADVLLPQTCITCGLWIPAGTGATCERCAQEIATLRQASYCPRCGRTMAVPAIHGKSCARCIHEPFWNIAGVARIGAYQGVLRPLITQLKYRGHERNAVFAAELLAAAMQRAGWAADIAGLVPVPMSWLRRVQRPCDHAALLATALGKQLGLRVMPVVRRLKHRPSQTNLASRQSRFANVKDCFGPKRFGARSVGGKTICIVDNLITSGATVCELSKVLRRAGAKKLYAAVIARAVLLGDPDKPQPDPPIAEASVEADLPNQGVDV